MGDRCWVRVFCHKKDQKLFEDEGFNEEIEPYGKCGVCLVDSQANYGSNDILREIASQGVPFWAIGGPGDSYGCFGVVSMGGETLEVATDHGYKPCVTVAKDGTLDEGYLEYCQEYQMMVKSLQAILKVEEKDR